MTPAFRVQKTRIAALISAIADKYPRSKPRVFRAPGRTELGGNHTDHNHGRVLAAGINLDIVAAAVKTADNRVTLSSAAYWKPYLIDLWNLRKRKEENHTTESLVRGIAAFIRRAGGEIGGFHAELSSTVTSGAGLSSSAAFEVLVATVFNHLYNDGAVPKLSVAKIAREAENKYYGKPCGLMDQLASAWGGTIAVDFARPDAPRITSVPLDLRAAGYGLYVVACGGDHAALTAAYRSVTEEMKSVAAFFKKRTLRELSPAPFLRALPRLRKKTGDRALLRALHFFRENERVDRQHACLKRGDVPGFLSLVRESRDSSWELLQNCWLPETPGAQGIGLALALSETILEGQGAARVHGGGFAGTIQCYVPLARRVSYRRSMEAVFGRGSVIPIELSPYGAMEIT